jgi:hypothetical protein
MSMSHADEGTLHAYIDGELPPAEAQGVAEHLANCPVCRGRVEEERALIARADQVLALARPPERDLPAFRARARQPPVRWWRQVRVPLTWAATIVLALGIGIYVGRLGPDRAGSPRVGPSLMPLASHTPAAESANAPMQQASLPAGGHPAPAAGTDRVVRSAPRQLATSNAPAPAATLARDEPAAKVAMEAEAERVLEASAVARLGDVVLGAPLSLDSARALLDGDPLAVPGLAVRAIHQGQMRGYSAVVVVEQMLDSGTTLAVITARPTVSGLAAVGVTGAAGAARPAAARPSEREGIARERAADSLDGLAREPRARSAARSDTRRAGLWFDLRGALAADSLAALGRRLEPLRP